MTLPLLPPTARPLACSAVLLMRYAQLHSGRSPVLLAAFERRVVFTLRERAACAPAFQHVLSLINTAAADGGGGGLLGQRRGAADGPSELEPLPLVGRRLEAGGVPRGVRPAWERGGELELWELRLRQTGEAAG